MLRTVALFFFSTAFCVGFSQTVLAQSDVDLERLLELLDSDKLATVNEAKELRAANAENKLHAALFDYGYGLILIKFSRWQDATKVLEPFADARPQVFRARLLAARAFVELEQYDHAVLQFEKLMQSLPTTPVDADLVARSCGRLYGFLSYARPDDCPEPLRQKLDQAAEQAFSESLMQKYKEAIQSVQSKVTELQNDIDEMSEKAIQEAQEKIEDQRQKAEELRADAEAKGKELESRDKDKQAAIEKLNQSMQQLQTQANQIVAREAFLTGEIRTLTRLQFSFVQVNPNPSNNNGNNQNQNAQSQANQIQYNRLAREILALESELNMWQGRSRALMATYQQLMSQAKGLMDQKQYEEFETKNQVSQLKKMADNKEKKADRENDRKSKKGFAATRALQNRLKNFATYDPMDMASNKQFLVDTAKRFLK